MHLLPKMTVAFCLACICSEIALFFVDSGWARRCIKTVAGLYILTVIFRFAPSIFTATLDISIPKIPAVDLGSPETLIFEEASSELEDFLEKRCKEMYGINLQLQILLLETEDEQIECQTEVLFEAGVDPAIRDKVLDYLEDELLCVPSWREDGS